MVVLKACKIWRNILLRLNGMVFAGKQLNRRGSGRGGGIDPLNKKITIVRKEFGSRVICKKTLSFSCL